VNFTISIPPEPDWRAIAVNKNPSPGRPRGKEIFIHLGAETPTCRIHKIRSKATTNILLGDIVCRRKEHHSEEGYCKSLFEDFQPDKIRHMPGFFYLIQFCSKEHWIRVFSSLFNILPVYYQHRAGSIHISSSLQSIRALSPSTLTPNPLYLMEKCLFYYPLFNHTWYNEVKLLAANSYLNFDGDLKIIKHTNIPDYYSSNPKSWRSALEETSDLFISRARDYLPGEHFIATLTGGFDSRAVVGLTLGKRLNFSTYSYGGPGTDDLVIPQQIAAGCGFNHHSIPINEEFAQKEFWRHALKFLYRSEGMGNMSRAHYSYAAEILGRESNCLVSGNFGSEILRAMKSPGVMVSQPVFQMFELEDLNELKESWSRNSALQYLNPVQQKELMDRLLAEVRTFRNALPDGLSRNQRFYVYLFEEVFRKYFGPEIIVENSTLRHRAPFLDFEFITTVLHSGLAGVYSRYRETRPLKRFQGQALYAHIQKKTCPKLLDYDLDRNYRPRDFLTAWGRFRIMAGYLGKHIGTRRSTSSPGYAYQCMNSNLDRIRKSDLNGRFFDLGYLERKIKGDWRYDLENFTNMVSAALYFNELFVSSNTGKEN